MIPISEANFIIVDVETTGPSAINDRIADIACITVKNFEITNTFSSLINPLRHIPSNIQKITSITDFMVKDAPIIKDVLGNIQELLNKDNTFFVAHNSVFDWSFVNESFKREFIFINEIPRICTLKIGRKIMPQNVKKNVGSLAEYFNIPIVNRHRAYDDAFATANFFIEMLYILQERYDITTVEEILEFQDKKQSTTLSKMNIKIKEKLLQYKKIAPEQSGLLIFIGIKEDILYITRTNNIAQYINSIIENTEETPKKISSMLKKINRLEWIETNTELETYIIENRKIKFYRPDFNSYKNIDLHNADDIKINEFTQDKIIEKLSMIVMLPNSYREKTIDIYFIHQGKFITAITAGAKSNLNKIFNELHNVFYSNENAWDDEVDIDEVKIISNWLKKYECIAKIFLFANQDELNFGVEVENNIRNFYDEPIKDNNFYISSDNF